MLFWAVLSYFSYVRPIVTPWAVARQDALFVEFSRRRWWGAFTHLQRFVENALWLALILARLRYSPFLKEPAPGGWKWTCKPIVCNCYIIDT